MMDKICSLCGSYYTNKTGHNPQDCVGILAQKRIEISRELRDIEQKFQEAVRRTKVKGS